ncbi:thioredoxin family protein [Pseudooceanicola sp. HF7]|uniref:DUF1223 domain-containing protein n=1 Tax=Pseudooceanicola sp. HF7 TaxID=2721560 RepID=UPI00142F84B9|nr:DUF1223 domain-containing protein [Pseudooceanicola sp. HF7]NIZ09842.1 DUF1223 domain-containing protein [Pseudooceanicola sp. HF7]
MIGRRTAMLMAGLAATWPLWSAGTAQADPVGTGVQTSSPVVVELFTSQGCSSCPPADALIGQLVGREDVLPLAMHVDYWDYLGWKDSLADPAFTNRQKAYAQARGKRMIYTPQMIVGGSSFLKGTHPMQLADYIDLHQDRPDAYTLEVDVQGEGRYRLIASEQRPGSTSPAPLTVQLIHYRPVQTVHIERGENAGAEITYMNTVASWADLGEWDGQGTLQIDFNSDADLPGAILLQRLGHGPIEGAIRLP